MPNKVNGPNRLGGISQNSVINNSDDGFEFDTSSGNNYFENNTLLENGNRGFYVRSSNNSFIAGVSLVIIGIFIAIPI